MSQLSVAQAPRGQRELLHMADDEERFRKAMLAHMVLGRDKKKFEKKPETTPRPKKSRTPKQSRKKQKTSVSRTPSRTKAPKRSGGLQWKEESDSDDEDVPFVAMRPPLPAGVGSRTADVLFDATGKIVEKTQAGDDADILSGLSFVAKRKPAVKETEKNEGKEKKQKGGKGGDEIVVRKLPEAMLDPADATKLRREKERRLEKLKERQQRAVQAEKPVKRGRVRSAGEERDRMRRGKERAKKEREDALKRVDERRRERAEREKERGPKKMHTVPEHWQGNSLAIPKSQVEKEKARPRKPVILKSSSAFGSSTTVPHANVKLPAKKSQQKKAAPASSASPVAALGSMDEILAMHSVSVDPEKAKQLIKEAQKERKRANLAARAKLHAQTQGSGRKRPRKAEEKEELTLRSISSDSLLGELVSEPPKKKQKRKEISRNDGMLESGSKGKEGRDRSSREKEVGERKKKKKVKSRRKSEVDRLSSDDDLRDFIVGDLDDEDDAFSGSEWPMESRRGGRGHGHGHGYEEDLQKMLTQLRRGRDPSRWDDESSDGECMEAGYDEVEQEELRSTKIASKEDRQALTEEQRRKREKERLREERRKRKRAHQR